MDTIITVALAVITALISFVTATIIERHRKKQELVLEYLIEAFKWLYTVDAIGLSSDTADDFNKSLKLVALFGSKKQIDLARQFIEDAPQNGRFDVKPLLYDLMNSLRKELKLEKCEPFTFIHAGKNSQKH
ncbi:MAG: hypothetical protein FWC91_13900 [Defluviitaleaceae bacterium]|nr:hypothetical protein [Defluviitaleaceae bacterium]